jgi:hypothetical protein
VLSAPRPPPQDWLTSLLERMRSDKEAKEQAGAKKKA